jgi:hypothetical protein
MTQRDVTKADPTEMSKLFHPLLTLITTATDRLLAGDLLPFGQ